MDRLEGSSTIEVENNIRVTKEHSLTAQDTVTLPKEATAKKVVNYWLNPDRR